MVFDVELFRSVPQCGLLRSVGLVLALCPEARMVMQPGVWAGVEEGKTKTTFGPINVYDMARSIDYDMSIWMEGCTHRRTHMKSIYFP